MSAPLTPLAFAWAQAQLGARTARPRARPLHLLGGCIAIADTFAVLLSSVGAYVSRHGIEVAPSEVAWTTIAATVLTVNGIALTGGYTRQVSRMPSRLVIGALQIWTAVFMVLLVVAYVTKTSIGFSRVWAISWYISGAVCLVLLRLAAAAVVRRWMRQGRLARTVAIVDIAGNGRDLWRRLRLHGAGEISFAGIFAPMRTLAEADESDVDRLIALSRVVRIDEVLVTSAAGHDDTTESVVRRLGTIPADIRLVLPAPSMSLLPRDASLEFGLPVVTIHRQPLSEWARVAKRAEDVIISATLLALLSPLLGLLAVLVKATSPGPALFRQKRLGFNNNVITVFKFRSMRSDLAHDEQVRQATRDDDRVTPLGRFLRRTSFDELPQFWNVLRGDMALVGPRPHALAHNEQYTALIDGYLARHRVQPGITGWAQVNGFRGETDTLDKMERRVEYDLYYANNWSLALDIKILARTVLLPLFDRNAY